jgi:hypothetical protein
MCECRGGKLQRVMKVTVVGPYGALSAGHNPSGERSECEHTCWDPKDGELCVGRVKPRETVVEARRGSDVQIDLQICVKGRKTNRTI